MMTLNSILSEINQRDWSAEIWQIKARQLDRQHEYTDAIKAIENAIELKPLSIYGWYLLVYLHNKSGSDKKVITTILDRIPESVFSRPSNLGFTLLAKMITGGDFTKAESHLIRWFIADPEGCSIPFTNVYLRFLITECDAAPRLSNTTEDCLGGVRYSSDGKVATKLLVNDDIETHHTLLSVSSPLGKLLSGMTIDETKPHGMLDIKLLERPPPYIATFQIASTLRQGDQ
jgi:tetratricopeptide (TPR) repeat protein